ncbi:MAG: type III pantothenate kinase [Ignavibacteriales bacterium]|nr:type III pantothenate kinase [Ignavibacteriales bacterium]
MLLAIDIGNTNAVFGIFQKGKLILSRRISSSVSRTEDELYILLKQFCEQIKTSPETLQGAVISSVVPELTELVNKMLKNYLKLEPLIISGMIDAGINIPYSDPSKLGADRICAVVAAQKKFGGPAIVVDFGTATTYDVITSKGEYLGGVIAPGVETMAANLFKRTSKLPRIDLRFPDEIIAKDTATAIRSGVMYGAVDSFEGMVRRLRRAAGKYATVVATGGYATIIAEVTNEIKYMEPNLVLEGARMIFERIAKKPKK